MSKSITERMIPFKHLNEVKAALNTISQLPVWELGDLTNVMWITLAKENLDKAMKSHKKIYEKASKALQLEYSHPDKPVLDKQGYPTGSYEWREEVTAEGKEEFFTRLEDLAMVEVAVAMPNLKLKLIGNKRITLTTVEGLYKGFWKEVVSEEVASTDWTGQ